MISVPINIKVDSIRTNAYVEWIGLTDASAICCPTTKSIAPRDCPRASPSGNLSGLGVQNPRPWEISWASGGVFSDTSLLSAVYGFNICPLKMERQSFAISNLKLKRGDDLSVISPSWVAAENWLLLC